MDKGAVAEIQAKLEERQRRQLFKMDARRDALHKRAQQLADEQVGSRATRGGRPCGLVRGGGGRGCGLFGRGPAYWRNRGNVIGASLVIS
eukprot:366573-Chlamydomonas_euryale.AAC.30